MDCKLQFVIDVGIVQGFPRIFMALDKQLILCETTPSQLHASVIP